MAFWKKVSAFCLAICIIMGAVPVFAEPNNKTQLNTATNTIDFRLGLGAVYDTISGDAAYTPEALDNLDITKQDAAALIYDMLLCYDASLEISEDEANHILNSCYDNGKLSEENRVAFAFCLKHGIFKSDIETYPSAVLDDEAKATILSRVQDSFIRDKEFMVSGKKLVMNSAEKALTDTFGEPHRVDKTIYGFSWYVYNSEDTGFFMAGVRGGRVCAFFTCDSGYEVLGYEKGMDYTEPSVIGLYVYTDELGKVDGVLYNPCEIETYTYTDEILACMENELLDIINAHRADDGKLALNKIDAVNSVFTFSESAGQNVQELFYGMLMQKGENPDIINETISASADAAVDIALTPDGGLRAAVATNAGVFGILPKSGKEGEISKESFDIKPRTFISAPKITSLKSGDVLNAGEDVTVELSDSVSDKYYVKIYDRERERDIVCQYITSDDTVFTYPKELFTPGGDYSLEMCSVDGDELHYADKTDFVYGEADAAVYIEAPFDGSATYDSEIEVFLASSVYHDFKLDVTNSDNEVIISKVLRGSDKTILDSIPSGKYTLTATALARGTDAYRGQHTVSFEIKKVTAVVREYVLSPNERFNFRYESRDGKYLYFYDQDVIYIDEQVQALDGLGNPIADELGNPVMNTVKSPRKKIVEKKVPATKQYRKLRAMYNAGSYTTGVITSTNATEAGNAFANAALLYQGIPYVWGGETPSGFDCSGLVKYVSGKLGKSVHRTSQEQFAYDGVFVEKSQLIPGDLLFFQDNGVIHHVGIYIGDGKMVHAPHTGDVVKVSSINSSYYVREYAGAKRIF